MAKWRITLQERKDGEIVPEKFGFTVPADEGPSATMEIVSELTGTNPKRWLKNLFRNYVFDVENIVFDIENVVFDIENVVFDVENIVSKKSF